MPFVSLWLLFALWYGYRLTLNFYAIVIKLTCCVTLSFSTLGTEVCQL
jgi:hypothetical protein